MGKESICPQCKHGYGLYGACRIKDYSVDVRSECADFVATNIRKIGEIGNYYGCLEIKNEDGKFFWSIENYDGHSWEEIPQELYNVLFAYEDRRKEDAKHV